MLKQQSEAWRLAKTITARKHCLSRAIALSNDGLTVTFESVIRGNRWNKTLLELRSNCFYFKNKEPNLNAPLSHKIHFINERDRYLSSAHNTMKTPKITYEKESYAMSEVVETIKKAWLKDSVTFEAELNRQRLESEADANADLRRGVSVENAIVRAKFARSANAASAHNLLSRGDFEAFGFLLSAGIIALNIACKILKIDNAKRTQMAVNQWES